MSVVGQSPISAIAQSRRSECCGTVTYFCDRAVPPFESDAENPGAPGLIAVTPTVDANNVPTPLPQQVKYRYDHLGRRVERKVYAWNTSERAWSTTPSEHVKYVWGPAGSVGVPAGQSAQWLVLMELDGLASNAALKKYTWGLDLAGLAGSVGQGGAGILPASLDAAGGIGGLLAVSDSGGSDPNLAGNYVFFYDGNGNVTQVARDIAGSGSIAGKLKARYGYPE